MDNNPLLPVAFIPEKPMLYMIEVVYLGLRTNAFPLRIGSQEFGPTELQFVGLEWMKGDPYFEAYFRDLRGWSFGGYSAAQIFVASEHVDQLVREIVFMDEVAK